MFFILTIKDQNYKENERSIKSTGLYLRKLESIYMKEKHMRNDSARKQHFQQHKRKHSNNKKAYTDGSKSSRRKVGYADVFTNVTKRGALPEEASIHTAEMIAIKVGLKEIQKVKTKISNIYRHSELYAFHLIQ